MERRIWELINIVVKSILLIDEDGLDTTGKSPSLRIIQLDEHIDLENSKKKVPLLYQFIYSKYYIIKRIGNNLKVMNLTTINEVEACLNQMFNYLRWKGFT